MLGDVVRCRNRVRRGSGAPDVRAAIGRAGQHEFGGARPVLGDVRLPVRVDRSEYTARRREGPGHSAAPASMIGTNFAAVRLAPPTRAPSTSLAPSSSRALSGVTDPP